MDNTKILCEYLKSVNNQLIEVLDEREMLAVLRWARSMKENVLQTLQRAHKYLKFTEAYPRNSVSSQRSSEPSHPSSGRSRLQLESNVPASYDRGSKASNGGEKQKARERGATLTAGTKITSN